jgi:predicted ArsR family transcriptional regulator
VQEGHTTPYERRRVTVAEAAEALGISAEAVRMRIRRGTLQYERHEGTVYVLLDADHTQHVADASIDRTDLLIAELQDRVRSLEEANRENRRIIAALTSRIPELEAPSTTRPPEGSQSATEGRVEPTPSEPTEGPQESSSTPWWRRIFGA